MHSNEGVLYLLVKRLAEHHCGENGRGKTFLLQKFVQESGNSSSIPIRLWMHYKQCANSSSDLCESVILGLVWFFSTLIVVSVHQGLRPRVVFASLEWDEHPLAQ